MQTYIILTKFAPHAFDAPAAFGETSSALAGKPGRECPGVHWKTSFAMLGRYDIVDIVEADDPVDVHRAAVPINTEARLHGNHVGGAVARVSRRALIIPSPRRPNQAGTTWLP